MHEEHNIPLWWRRDRPLRPSLAHRCLSVSVKAFWMFHERLCREAGNCRRTEICFYYHDSQRNKLSFSISSTQHCCGVCLGFGAELLHPHGEGQSNTGFLSGAYRAAAIADTLKQNSLLHMSHIHNAAFAVKVWGFICSSSTWQRRQNCKRQYRSQE